MFAFPSTSRGWSKEEKKPSTGQRHVCQHSELTRHAGRFTRLDDLRIRTPFPYETPRARYVSGETRQGRKNSWSELCCRRKTTTTLKKRVKICPLGNGSCRVHDANDCGGGGGGDWHVLVDGPDETDVQSVSATATGLATRVTTPPRYRPAYVTYERAYDALARTYPTRESSVCTTNAASFFLILVSRFVFYAVVFTLRRRRAFRISADEPRASVSNRNGGFYRRPTFNRRSGIRVLPDVISGPFQ